MMPIADIAMGAARGIVAPIARIFQLKQERKTVVQTIQARAAQTQTEGEVSVNLKRAEWENIAQRLQGGTWKDEFITLIVFSPFIVAMAGAVLAAFGRPELSEAAANMFAVIHEMGVNYGDLLMIVTCAGIGIRIFR